MRVLLIPIDGKIPNLAIMKLSAWHKAQGDDVGFRMTDPEKVYISVIFEKNLPHARGIAKFYPDVELEIGGPALGSLNVVKNLPDEVEHMMPDYALYGIDYSIGFTTRGCIRKCSFCQVWKVEGDFREHAPITEFHHPDHKKIVLFDNNFLASEHWNEKLEYLLKNKLDVSFTQGLDARLMDKEKAKQLRLVRYYNIHFTSRKLYFAWDFVEEETAVMNGLKLIIDAGVAPSSIIVYMLAGFNTTHEEDIYRFKQLRKIGVDPFVMVWDNRMDDPWLRHFSRYVNKWFYRSVPFEKYKRGVLIE